MSTIPPAPGGDKPPSLLEAVFPDRAPEALRAALVRQRDAASADARRAQLLAAQMPPPSAAPSPDLETLIRLAVRLTLAEELPGLLALHLPACLDALGVVRRAS